MKIYAFIFARGGSKGLPRKNIRLLQGKPLIAYAIESAQSLPIIDACFVSTDDPEIAAIAKEYGAQVIDRPSELATDTAPEWLAWQQAVRWVEQNAGTFDYFVSLPATSPLRTTQDVQNCIDLAVSDSNVDMVVTMSPSTRSPWFNMVKMKDDALDLLIRDTSIKRRQDAPISYDLTTVAYVSRPDFIASANSMWDGCVKGVSVSSRSAVDIDTMEDFLYAEFLLAKAAQGQKNA